MKWFGKNFFCLVFCVLIGITALASAAANPAETAVLATDASVPDKPDWLTELSLGIRESYDDNLFGVSGDGMPKRHSRVTSLSPKIGIDLARIIKQQDVWQVLSLNYEPDWATYDRESEENHVAHRLGNKIRARSGNLSFALENSFIYIDGSSDAAIYPAPDNVRSSYAHALPRERRKQFQDRMKVEFQLDWNSVFFRPTGSLQYWDMLTDQRAISGYQNWIDRYDVNGGMDLGYRISSQLAVFLGYRYGRQYQGYPLNSDYSSTNEYHRTLVGVEGNLFKWLTLSVSCGPDFRKYDDSAPVNEKDQVNFFGESALTARLSEHDTVAVKYKATRWISSTGQVPTFDTSVELGFRHKFDDKLSWNLNGLIRNSDYTVGNYTTGSAPSLRNDWLYSPSTRLAYAVNTHFEVTIGITANLGRNEQDGISNADYREFDEYVSMIGVLGKF